MARRGFAQAGSGQSPVADLFLERATRRGAIIDPLQSLGRLAQALASNAVRGRDERARKAEGEAFAKEIRDTINAGDFSESQKSQLIGLDPQVAQTVLAGQIFNEPDKEKGRDEFEIIPSEEAERLGFPKGVVAQRNKRSNEFEVLQKAPGQGKTTKRTVGDIRAEILDRVKKQPGDSFQEVLKDIPTSDLVVLNLSKPPDPRTEFEGQIFGIGISHEMNRRKKAAEAATGGGELDAMLQQGAAAVQGGKSKAGVADVIRAQFPDVTDEQLQAAGLL